MAGAARPPHTNPTTPLLPIYVCHMCTHAEPFALPVACSSLFVIHCLIAMPTHYPYYLIAWLPIVTIIDKSETCS